MNKTIEALREILRLDGMSTIVTTRGIKKHSLTLKRDTDVEKALTLAKEKGFLDAKATGKRTISIAAPAAVPTKKVLPAKKQRTRKPSERVCVMQRTIEQLVLDLQPKVRYRTMRNIVNALPGVTRANFVREMGGGAVTKTTDAGGLAKYTVTQLAQELVKRTTRKRRKK